MKKSGVYTKTGDKGDTGLVSGSRVSKADARIDLYGNIDELNSFIGVAYRYFREEVSDSKVLELLHKIQITLFDIGSNFACEGKKRDEYKLPIIDVSIILEMEEMMDKIDSTLPKLNKFILPGGSLSGAQFHVCRTVTRRVERLLIAYENKNKKEILPNALIFLNRLSDYFFILSRYANLKKDEPELRWIAKMRN